MSSADVSVTMDTWTTEPLYGSLIVLLLLQHSFIYLKLDRQIDRVTDSVATVSCHVLYYRLGIKQS